MQFPMQDKNETTDAEYTEDPDDPFANFNIRRDSELLQRQY